MVCFDDDELVEEYNFIAHCYSLVEEYRCPLAVTCDCGCGFGCQVSVLAVDASVEEFGLFGFS